MQAGRAGILGHRAGRQGAFTGAVHVRVPGHYWPCVAAADLLLRQLAGRRLRPPSSHRRGAGGGRWPLAAHVRWRRRHQALRRHPGQRHRPSVLAQRLATAAAGIAAAESPALLLLLLRLHRRRLPAEWMRRLVRRRLAHRARRRRRRRDQRAHGDVGPVAPAAVHGSTVAQAALRHTAGGNHHRGSRRRAAARPALSIGDRITAAAASDGVATAADPPSRLPQLLLLLPATRRFLPRWRIRPAQRR